MLSLNIAERLEKWPDLRYRYLLVQRFVVLLVQNFIANGCIKNAAALTYVTLFAIVPSLTVIFAVFSIVPAFTGVDDMLRDFIFSNFVPETGEEIQEYLVSFAEQARSLTGFGLGVLVVTAYLMLTNIEKTFNTIWGVERPRRGLSSFLLYWAVLSIGPILLGAGFAMSGYLLSLQLVMDGYGVLGLGSTVLYLLPWFTAWGALTLLFIAVPNCHVPFKFGLIGGAVTAACFELLKYLFATFMARSNYQLIYGAFALVPLFLLWINMVWIVILAGAVLVRTMAERRYATLEGRAADMVSVLKCLSLFQSASLRGGKVSDKDCYRVGLGVVHWQGLRARLVDKKWIAATASGNYVLIRDLRMLTMWDLALLVELRFEDLVTDIANPAKARWFPEFMERREQLATFAQEVLGMSVEEFLDPAGLRPLHDDDH